MKKKLLWPLYILRNRLRIFFTRQHVHETPQGERYRINPHSLVERWIEEGGFEVTRSEYLRAQLGSGDVFVDIGANIGLYTILAAHRGASVVAFEPDPINFKRLLYNIKINNFPGDRVIAHSCALGNEIGQITMRRPLEGNYGMSSMMATDSPDVFEVPLKRLDDVLAVSAKRHVVKIDVEGAELMVLDGAKTLLKNLGENSLWLVEVHLSVGVEIEAVESRFRQFGYEIAYFDDKTGKIVDRALSDDPLLVARRPATSAP